MMTAKMATRRTRTTRMRCRRAGPEAEGGRVKSLGSPIHPRVILPPPRGRGIVVIEGRGD